METTSQDRSQLVPVYDWLRGDTSIPGAFIVYPPEYDTPRAIGALIGALLRSGGATVLFMVQEPNKIVEAIGMNLPPEIFVPYGESQLVEAALQQEVWLVVDSIRLFRTLRIGDIARRKQARSRFLVFDTLGFSTDDLEYLNGALPGIWSLYTSFIDRRLTLQFMLNDVGMSERQNERFILRTQRELVLSQGTSQERHRAREKLLTRQIGNFVYPENIQAILDAPRETRAFAPPDLPVPQGWIQPSFLQEIGQYSPKLQRFLTNVFLNREGRHLVYTRFKERHGSVLFQTLISQLGLPSVRIEGDNTAEERRSAIENFNRDGFGAGVFITTVIPPVDLVRVTSVHFIDEIGMDLYKSIMEKVFKVNLLPDRSTVNVYIYVAKPGQGESPDSIDYRYFSERINSQSESYNKVVEGSIPILFEANTGKINMMLPIET